LELCAGRSVVVAENSEVTASGSAAETAGLFLQVVPCNFMIGAMIGIYIFKLTWRYGSKIFENFVIFRLNPI
jgi:hypothetical protein